MAITTPPVLNSIEGSIAAAHRAVTRAALAASSDVRHEGLEHDLSQIGRELHRLQESLTRRVRPLRGEVCHLIL